MAKQRKSRRPTTRSRRGSTGSTAQGGGTIKPRGYALFAFWAASTIFFAATSDEPGLKAAIGTGTAVTFGGAFVLMGLIGWVRDLGANDNPGFRESKRTEHPCFRSWAAAMFPFSWTLGVMAVAFVFAAYDELEFTDAMLLGAFWLFVAGLVLTVTIHFWRQPWFLVSAEGRREVREAQVERARSVGQ